MPSAKIGFFLDSNILIYAATAKKNDPRKYSIASQLVVDRSFGVSGQTLAEFCSVTLRKALLVPTEIEDWLALLGELPFVPVDAALVQAGLALARRFRISYYDAALLVAAEELGAEIFYTEDLNHNQLYGPVRAINPFLEN